MLIYNLAKYYKALEFNKNYLEQVNSGKIKYDENITLDTFVDENREFLK